MVEVAGLRSPPWLAAGRVSAGVEVARREQEGRHGCGRPGARRRCMQVRQLRGGRGGGGGLGGGRAGAGRALVRGGGTDGGGSVRLRRWSAGGRDQGWHPRPRLPPSRPAWDELDIWDISPVALDRCDTLSILFYSILFYSILFYSILFYSILFTRLEHVLA